jgi:hypothetical protein
MSEEPGGPDEVVCHSIVFGRARAFSLWVQTEEPEPSKAG